MSFRKILLSLALVWATLVSLLAQHLEVTGRHRITLIYDYSASRSGDGPGRFYLPVPPDTGCQTITAFHSSWPGKIESVGDSPPRHILAGTVPAQGRPHWRVRITGIFTTHALASGPPPSAPLSAPAPGQYLGASESIDWKSAAFQRWLDARGLRRAPDETAVAYGRRLYDYLADHGRYAYPPSGGWTASGAARRLHTDCGGFSLVFVAACRANDVPARLLVGQWFKTGSSGGLSAQPGRQAHVIAECFDPRIGWIPEDVSSRLLHTPGAEDYFGREPGIFFAWHVDTDFHFNVPGGANGHVQWIQNPSPWFNKGEGGSGSHHWTFISGASENFGQN